MSTTDQDAQLQLDALTAADCQRIYTDHASGAATARPELDRLLDTARPGDAIVVWRLDRLARSMQHLLDLAAYLEARGVGLAAGDKWTNDDDLVFTDGLGRAVDAGTDHDAWEALLREAKIRDIRLHDARHTAATLLHLAGVPPRAAMEWLGHSQISQTMRYTHVASETAADTGKRLGKTLFGA